MGRKGKRAHLQDVRNGEVYVTLLLGVKVLCAFHDDEVAWKIHPPRQSGRTHQDLNLGFRVERLDNTTVLLVEAGVVQANPKRKAVPQGGIFDGLQYDLKLVLRHVKELLGRVVRHGVRDEIVRRDARLPPRGHEYEHGLGRRVRLDCCIRWFVHRRHARAIELAAVSLNVTLQRHRPHRGAEIEEPLPVPLHVPRDAHPRGKVPCIRQRRRQAHQSYGRCCLLGDVAHAADDHFEDGASVPPQQMDLIDDHQTHLAKAMGKKTKARERKRKEKKRKGREGKGREGKGGEGRGAG